HKHFTDIVSAFSLSGTPKENDILPVYKRYFDGIPYFKDHPELCGFYDIPGDHLNRKVPFGLLRGNGNDTVVLIHHSDVVDTLNYLELQPLATNSEALDEALRSGQLNMDDDSKADLLSGEWIFGRGVADMKGGGADQMALFEEYATRKEFNGNLLILPVADEESYSTGMRGAVLLMTELKKKYGLNYITLIDSEPDSRKINDRPTITDGSVGKILPIVYVQGVPAHVGYLFDGFNPATLLSEIVVRTDANMEFSEKSGNSVASPPSWLYVKDQKYLYDVTLPAAAMGCISILSLDRSPVELFALLKKICADAMDDVISKRNSSFQKYTEMHGTPVTSLLYKTCVMEYGDVYEEAKRDSGDEFVKAITELIRQVGDEVKADKLSFADAASKIIEKTLSFRKDRSPVVVLALIPPYYPCVNNKMVPDRMPPLTKALNEMQAYAAKNYGGEYGVVNYISGISDLSYGMFTASDENIDFIGNNMLFWKDLYYVPLAEIRDNTMPVINIGPYGKDFHKFTERVYKDDLYYRVPVLLDIVISDLLGNERIFSE
ncbi:M20/M25/M40 family metallo-hydrolase, partial [Oscillospiraceae bacterium OttesenSCG-928-G22]|nr:M20/M25/M40 family metallo-hydrolase [Oscillospiraceae bacterium OttesenSCG-928-G22]